MSRAARQVQWFNAQSVTSVDNLECGPSHARELRADRQVQWFNGQSKPSVGFDLMLNSGCRIA